MSFVNSNCVPNDCRNLSSLHWISTAGVCGFIYSAIAIVYESSKVRFRVLRILGYQGPQETVDLSSSVSRLVSRLATAHPLLV